MSRSFTTRMTETNGPSEPLLTVGRQHPSSKKHLRNIRCAAYDIVLPISERGILAYEEASYLKPPTLELLIVPARSTEYGIIIP